MSGVGRATVVRAEHAKERTTERIPDHTEITGASSAESEAYEVLLARAHRKTGRVPTELVVRHVLAVTRGGDWPVQRDALEALLRRFAFGRADGLQIVARPPRGQLLGLYATRRRGSSSRPYRTLLRRIEPIWGSCDCPDFLRSSLALCKHLLAVLEDVVSRPRALDKATREPIPNGSHLHWDPVRPLTGPGDWLAQVRWVDGTPNAGLRRWLSPVEKGAWTLVVPEKREQRLTLVEALLGVLREGHGEPALHALLQEDRRAIEREILGVRSLETVREAFRTLKKPLFPYQREGVERFLSRGRLLLADDMGLGKTAQAIAACHALLRAGQVRRGLLIVPAALKPQWLREWQLFTDVPVAVVDGSARRSAARIYQDSRRGFLIVNYEQLLRDLAAVHGWAPGPRRPRRGAADQELGDQDGGLREAARSRATASSSPARRWRTGSTSSPRSSTGSTTVALEPKWRLAPWHTTRRRRCKRRSRGARNLDTLRDAPRAVHGAARPPGGAGAAPAAHRHPRAGRR